MTYISKNYDVHIQQKDRPVDQTKALVALAKALILMEEILAKSQSRVQQLQQKAGTSQINQANQNYTKVVKAVNKYEHAKHEHHSFWHKLVSSVSNLLSDVTDLLKKLPGVSQINDAVNAGINITAEEMHKATGLNTELCKGLVKIALIAAVTGGAGAVEEGSGAAVAGEATESTEEIEMVSVSAPGAQASAEEDSAAVNQNRNAAEEEKAGKTTEELKYTQALRSALILTMDPTTDLLVGGAKQMGIHNKIALAVIAAVAQIINMIIAGKCAPEMSFSKEKALQGFMALEGITGGITSIWNGVIALQQAKATKDYAKAMKKFTLSDELAKLLKEFVKTHQKQIIDMFKGFQQINRSFGSFTKIDQTIAKIRA